MKRFAEKQLSKDDDVDDEIEEVTPPEGFKKAEDSVLATRKIKALPKRALTASSASLAPSAPSTPEPPSVPKFNGFAGFGAAAASSTPFGFSATSGLSTSSKPAVPALPTTKSFSFSTLAFGTSPTPASTLLVAASASPATKAFGAMLGSSIAPSPKATSTDAFSSPDDESSSLEDDEYEAEVKLFTAFRGLNLSFLSAMSKAIESDPFVDVAKLLDRYKSYRVSAQIEYDETVKQTHGSSRSPDTTAKPISASKPSSTTPLTTWSSSKTLVAMPTPPSSFAEFKPPSSTAFSFGTSSTKGDGPIVSLPFPLGGSATAAAENSSSGPTPPKTAFSFGPSDSSSGLPAAETSGLAPPRPTFTFGSSSSSSSILAAPIKSSFTFGKSDTSTSSASSFFGASSAPSAFSSNLFAPQVEEKTKGKESKEASTPVFGSSGSPFGSGPPAFGTPEKSSNNNSSLTFGTSTPTKPFGGFGKSSGSIGNPVGFGFGSPPKFPDLDAPASSSTTAPKLPGLSTLLAPPTAETSRGSSLEAHASTGSIESTPAPDTEGEGSQPQPLTASASVNDLEGEGEEDEETTHEVKTKVYKMVRVEGEKADQTWGIMGVGFLRLKKHKETGARRVLLRNSSTGKVILNFKIYSGMETSAKNNFVSFIGHEDGAAMPFRIRTKTEDDAAALKMALDREIEFVRAKSDEP